MSKHEIRIGGGGVVAKPKPVWSAAKFALILGQEGFDKLESQRGNSKQLRYAQYVLERSTVVDLNDPQVLALLESLSPSVISAENLAILKGE